MTEPTITQADELADAICGCANREQHRRDVALIEAYREAAVAELRVALHDAINSPKGVVPDSAMPFYKETIHGD